MAPLDTTSDYTKEDYWLYKLFFPETTPAYPKDSLLYRLFFGLNEKKTRAELGHMLGSVGLDESGQIMANDNENQNYQAPDIEYFIVDPKGKDIDRDEIRAASVYWWPETEIACLMSYLLFQNNYGIAKSTRTYYSFFFGLLNKPSLITPFVRGSVGLLLPGTAVAVIASKALKIIHFPRKISPKQETLLRVIKEYSSKIKNKDHQKTLLIVLEREEYLQEIKKDIDAKYGFLYAAYIQAEEDNIRLVFAAGMNIRLNLSQIVEAVAKQSEFTDIKFSVLPYSKKYHEDTRSNNSDHDFLDCRYSHRRLISKQEFRPDIDGSILCSEVFFSGYIMFFNYFCTYLVSICQAYITLITIFGINENSSTAAQIFAILGAIFIGGVRNQVTIDQKEESAEKYYRALFSSFSTLFQTYALNPTNIIYGLAAIISACFSFKLHSWHEFFIRRQQLGLILYGIGVELATHFTYASNTLFFFHDTVTILSKLILHREFSSNALFICSLLAAFGQVSLNSMSQGSISREKYFKKARELEKEISKPRASTTMHECIHSILLILYNKDRSWRDFLLSFFIGEDAINTACTAAAGLINVIGLYNPSMPTGQVVGFSLILGWLMFSSQTAFNKSSIDDDLKTFEKLFFCHTEGPDHPKSGRYSGITNIPRRLSRIGSLLHSTENKSRGSSAEFGIPLIHLAAKEDGQSIVVDTEENENPIHNNRIKGSTYSSSHSSSTFTFASISPAKGNSPYIQDRTPSPSVY